MMNCEAALISWRSSAADVISVIPAPMLVFLIGG
jgi:hypothetical protein